MPAGNTSIRNRGDAYKAVRDDATPVSITYYHTDSYKNTCGFSTKKSLQIHTEILITPDYQCVTNDPVAPSRMRIHLRLARQTTGRASTSNSGNAYKSSAGYNQPVTPKTPTST